MSKRRGGAVEGAVKAQYERFPYPPPIDAIPPDHLTGQAALEGCPSRSFHLFWPAEPKRGDLDILVAGCGSSQSVLHACAMPQARFTAIDLSATSIANSRKLARKHGITNIDFRQMSLYDVAELGRDFDLIISTGVIHHLPDPGAGLAALRGVLRPSGAMLIMLYGRYGRDSVYLFQDLFRRMGLTAETVTHEEVSQIGDLVRSAPPTHPIHARRLYYNDFRPEELVDLYLHPQDRAYTVPEIHDLLAASGLALQRFVHQAPYFPRFSGLMAHPFYARVEALPLREQFAITELYRAGMHTHTFVACRDDRPSESYRIDLDGEAFWSYVPELCFGVNRENREDGQPGAKLSVNGHSQFKSPVTIDRGQLLLLNMVDGIRSVEDLVGEMRRFGDEDTVRSFVRAALGDFWKLDAILFRTIGPTDSLPG